MSTAVLSVGSNLGDRLAAVQRAVDALRPWVQAMSPVYETAPWGPVPQEDFLNAVLIAADEQAAPADWLARAQAAERAGGPATYGGDPGPWTSTSSRLTIW
jgi:2-amino-4-hydroxy-6-hydroxymethyldihydropteridine diphosphokinase